MKFLSVARVNLRAQRRTAHDGLRSCRAGQERNTPIRRPSSAGRVYDRYSSPTVPNAKAGFSVAPGSASVIQTKAFISRWAACTAAVSTVRARSGECPPRSTKQLSKGCFVALSTCNTDFRTSKSTSCSDCASCISTDCDNATHDEANSAARAGVSARPASRMTGCSQAYAGVNITAPTSAMCVKLRTNRYVWSPSVTRFTPACVSSSISSATSTAMVP